jgi:hypothetical protein
MNDPLINKLNSVANPNNIYTGMPTGLNGVPLDALNTSSPSSQPAASSTSAAPVDPYASFGGKAAYDTLVSAFGTQKDNILGTAHDAAASAGLGYKNDILDFVDSLTGAQNKVNQRSVNNDLTKIQGGRSILDMVGRGIRSGGVMLNNKNAADSSAAGEIARAYGLIGKGQGTQLGNQYALEGNNIMTDQDAVNTQQAAGLRKFGDSKEQIVGGIVSQARDKLAALDAAMADKSMPERIALEQEKEKVRTDALAQLSQYDSLLSNGVAGVHHNTADETRNKAYDLANKGAQLGTAFDFSASTPTALQGTGPFSSDLPLFTLPRRNQV